MGEDGSGPLVAKFERPSRSPLAPCKCCTNGLQVMNVVDANGNMLGMAREARCWRGVPKLDIIDAAGNHEFELHQPTCCCGQLVDTCGLGVVNYFNPCSNWSPPVMFTEAGMFGSSKELGRITNLHGAFELRMTGQMALRYSANAYQLKIPAGSSPDRVARVLAGFLLSFFTLLDGHKPTGVDGAVAPAVLVGGILAAWLCPILFGCCQSGLWACCPGGCQWYAFCGACRPAPVVYGYYEP